MSTPDSVEDDPQNRGMHPSAAESPPSGRPFHTDDGPLLLVLA